jgi:hypothetical protein
MKTVVVSNSDFQSLKIVRLSFFWSRVLPFHSEIWFRLRGERNELQNIREKGFKKIEDNLQNINCYIQFKQNLMHSIQWRLPCLIRNGFNDSHFHAENRSPHKLSVCPLDNRNKLTSSRRSNTLRYISVVIPHLIIWILIQIWYSRRT